MKHSAVLFILLISLVGCDQSPTGDAGTEPVDSGTPGMDASTRDASSPRDADQGDTGNPAADAGPEDSDGDGIPDDSDCAPDDVAVGTSATRACSGVCGDGQEECSDGVWSACDAPTDCTCDAEGATRIASCGMCGEQSQRCTDGTWQAESSCLNQGECAVGAVESRDGERCAVEERLCRSDCSWGDWDFTTEAGECEPDERGCLSLGGELVYDYLCTNDCRRVDNPCCPSRAADPCCEDISTCLE